MLDHCTLPAQGCRVSAVFNAAPMATSHHLSIHGRTMSIADMFKAELDDLMARSAETDKRMAETLTKIHGHIAEFKQLDKDLAKLESEF